MQWCSCETLLLPFSYDVLSARAASCRLAVNDFDNAHHAASPHQTRGAKALLKRQYNLRGDVLFGVSCTQPRTKKPRGRKARGAVGADRGYEGDVTAGPVSGAEAPGSYCIETSPPCQAMWRRM